MVDTMAYFIAGYVVIFGLLGFYALRLFLLAKKVSEDKNQRKI